VGDIQRLELGENEDACLGRPLETRRDETCEVRKGFEARRTWEYVRGS
jgi:hypothetical protein